MTKSAIRFAGEATFALGAAAVSSLHAQSNAPYYQVAGSTSPIRPVTKRVALTRFRRHQGAWW